MVIDAEDLGRTFSQRTVLAGLTFSLGAGDCLALFGPNGAGKTTLLRILSGLLKPTSGRASIAGISLPGGESVRARVGIVSHHSMLYPALTARENVAFAARMFGIGDPDAAALTALRRMRMDDRAETPVRVLSRGMQQRTSIARALVHSPAVLLLDEPYTGLDEAGADALTSTLRALRDGGSTLVLVTHHLSEGLALASHAAIMRAGRFARVDAAADVDPSRYAQQYRSLVVDAA